MRLGKLDLVKHYEKKIGDQRINWHELYSCKFHKQDMMDYIKSKLN